MIRNASILRDFERELVRKEPVDISANFRVVESLYEEAVGLGIFPIKDPLDGLKTVLRIATVVNSVPGTARDHRQGME